MVGALMQLSDAACAEALVGALTDAHPAVRRRAAKRSFSAGNPAMTQRVLRSVALSDFLQAASFGTAALEPLMAALKDFNVESPVGGGSVEPDRRRAGAEAIVDGPQRPGFARAGGGHEGAWADS